MLRYTAFCLLLVLLNGCYSNRVVGLLQERDNLPQYEKTEHEPYRIHVNDEIIYRLITMDETIAKTLTQGTTVSTSEVNSYRVYSDGTIDLPFLEPIRVQGLTLEEAQNEVQRCFREIIPDADVKLSVYNKTFTIIGDVNSGTYPVYKEKLTIYQALAMSGDLMNQGDRKHVRIIRPRDNAAPEVLEFDIRTNTLIDSKYYYVYPNDVIYVARSKGSFYKVASYSGFLALITSSLALLVSVLNYTTLVP
ncbi:MAG: polysaccharide biosynthesis/export family protein [Bacteroides sp.]|nr:polysaccharide biosynthesis/export family protein [Bacteroidales bacterium]MCM1069534.1 polysaccharide biosynthesis/export family protein [Prevotella sp.]MCM1354711.1 polysaccharide biosynthesis/export family protein [Bacteroides sp.]MCM1443556.1 polysaccharide biosynthesis/export family protein [Muribaculum sp.]